MPIPPFVWLIAIPLLASPVVYFAGRLSELLKPRFAGREIAARNGRRPSLAYWAALLAALAAWIPLILAIGDLSVMDVPAYRVGAVPLRWDGLSALLAVVTLGLGTLVIFFSGSYMAAEAGEEKYYAMLIAMMGVMIALGMAADLFNLWVWFEAMAITSYLLVAFYREQPASLEAGVKYVVQSASGSVLVLLGISLVLAQTGTLDLGEIRNAAGSTPLMLAAGALFLVGYGVKIALVPLHTWLPDAHAQAPSGISAMLSGIVIEAGLVALLRSLAPLAGAAVSWGILFMAFAAVNMLVGNLMALRQTQVKRLLAYSSLAHIGYMVLGLGIAIYAGQAAGAQGSVFHLLNHALMKGLAFLSAGVLLYTLHLAAGSHSPLTIPDLAGAAQRYPLAAIGLSIAVLGLGGLPPLAGFMSKWQIFVSGFATHNAIIMGLVIFAALNSVLSLAYYAPLVNAVYRKQPSAAVASGKPVPALMNLPLVFLSAAVIVIGLWPSLLSWLTEPSAAVLLTAFGR